MSSQRYQSVTNYMLYHIYEPQVSTMKIYNFENFRLEKSTDFCDIPVLCLNRVEYKVVTNIL